MAELSEPSEPIVPLSHQGYQNSRKAPVSLARVLSADTLVDHVRNASDEEISRLLEYVPGLASNREELLTVVRSPHLSQSLSQLSGLMYQGSTGVLSQHMGVPYYGEGVEAFLRAVYDLQQHAGEPKPQSDDQPE